MGYCRTGSGADYFYPRPPRGGRPSYVGSEWGLRNISIHALREEGDQDPAGQKGGVLDISIHALREEGDPFCPVRPEGRWRFLSTPSARRATRHRWPHRDVRRNFYPRPPRGGRPGGRQRLFDEHHFYPRPPRGGRPDRAAKCYYVCQFLSTPSARRATRCYAEIEFDTDISIHALREEGDDRGPDRAGGRGTFLSTPSARRATTIAPALFCARTISIHALREEGDGLAGNVHFLRGGFLSTPSARRATRPQRQPARGYPISIHALREEGDAGSRYSPRLQQYFYPRPPRGGRRNRSTTRRPARRFLSTPSARRATQPFRPKLCKKVISIHALREEGDAWRWLMVTFTVKFLSTPSARRATGGNFTAFHALGKFLSTPSARRATWLSSLSARRWRISIHALREEGDVWIDRRNY